MKRILITKEILLVLAPHPDDESLGCGGMIAKIIEEGGNVFILVFTKNYAKDSNYKEFHKAINVLGIPAKNCFYTSFDDQTLKLDQVGLKNIIFRIEEVCNIINPTIVAIPFIKSFHQDHEVVGKAAMTALRPHGYMSKKVLIYEQPYYGTWSTEFFKPNYYIDITNYLGKKIDSLLCYESQKIPFDMVTAMAKVRGYEVGRQMAEAYMLMREII